MKVQKHEKLDWVPLVVGVITFLKQFHSDHTHVFLAYIGQFVRSAYNMNMAKYVIIGYCSPVHVGFRESEPMSVDVTNILLFLEDFCRFGQFSRRLVEGYIPQYIFDNFRQQM